MTRRVLCFTRFSIRTAAWLLLTYKYFIFLHNELSSIPYIPLTFLGKMKKNTACNRIKQIFYTINSYLLNDPSMEGLQKMEP